jgi:hypothetical protein
MIHPNSAMQSSARSDSSGVASFFEHDLGPKTGSHFSAFAGGASADTDPP